MKLALNGGVPVREKMFPAWPIWGIEEEKGLIDVLQSGRWGSIKGDVVAQFESEFAGYQDAKYGIAVSSGTTGLEVALRSAGIAAGDEVIVPAYTFIASATAVLNNAAIPVFVDIDPGTYNLNEKLIEEKITSRTKAIMPVHFGGRPANMHAICEIAERHNLRVIEDAAQAWGAKVQGKGAGALGDAGCFSFQASKNINAGEGGIILTDDPAIAELAESYVNCGRKKDGLWYAHYRIGSNLRMTEFQGALLRAQMSRYGAQLNLRREAMDALDKGLAEIPAIDILRPLSGASHACHIYIARYLSDHFAGIPRDVFINALRAEGIPCSPGYSLPLYEQPLFLDENYGPFQDIVAGRVDYHEMKLPETHAACYSEALWFTQNTLLEGRDGAASIIAAVEKIVDNRDELAVAPEVRA